MLLTFTHQTHQVMVDALPWLSFAIMIVSQFGSSLWSEPESGLNLLVRQCSLATADDLDMGSVLLGFTVAVLLVWSQCSQLPRPDVLKERSRAQLRVAAGLLSRAAVLQVNSCAKATPAWRMGPLHFHCRLRDRKHVASELPLILAVVMHHDIPHAVDQWFTTSTHRCTQQASSPTAKQGLAGL